MAEQITDPERVAVQVQETGEALNFWTQPERITITWSEERFSPVSFNSFGVGPFTLETEVRPDETLEAAMDRAYEFLNAYARKIYLRKRADFFARYEGKS